MERLLLNTRIYKNMASNEEKEGEGCVTSLNPFGLLMIEVGNDLTEDKRKQICMLLGFTPTENEKVKDAMDLLFLMQTKDLLNDNNVNTLKEALETVGLVEAAKRVESYQRRTEICPGEILNSWQLQGGAKKTPDISEDAWSYYAERFSYHRSGEDPLCSLPVDTEVLNFVLIGKTGSGKSATGNTILGWQYFKENHGTSSETKYVSQKQFQENGRDYKIMDTPGLFETGITDLNIQHFQNRWLCLEIAKASSQLIGGIHLFLVIYNPYSKFTQEEEKTISYVESVMGEEMYSFCVLILTHSKDKFDNISLKEFLADEQQNGGKFAKLITRIQGRVVAVENSFTETILREDQRNCLIQRLVEEVRKNNGKAYSNEVLTSASESIKKADKDREKKFKKLGQKLFMTCMVDQHVYHLLFSLKLTTHELNDLNDYFSRNLNQICKKCKISKLEFITAENVKTHLGKFAEDNKSIVRKYVTLTSEWNDQFNKVKNWQKEVIYHIYYMLTKFSKDTFFTLQTNSELRNHQLQKLFNKLLKKGIGFHHGDVEAYFLSYLFKATEILQNVMTNNATDADPTNEHDTMADFRTLSCAQQAQKILYNLIVTFQSVNKIRDTEIEKRLEEHEVNQRLLIISDIIDKKLKRFLSKLNRDELKKMQNQLSNNKVPPDIRNEILEYLFQEKKMTFDAFTIENEIQMQLQINHHTLQKQIHKATTCFPVTGYVITSGNVKTPIAFLQVGDEVLVYDSKGNLKYEKVFLLSHANKEIHAVYIKIVTKSGKVLFLSPNHCLPINKIGNIVPAKEAAEGNSVFSITDGVLTPDVIAKVSYKICKGAFCPMTLTGKIVVDNVATSCYTTFFSPGFGLVLLFPLRVMFHYLPKSVFNALLPYDSAEGMPILLSKFRRGIIFVRSIVACVKDLFRAFDV